jgi:hypothetical protein
MENKQSNTPILEKVKTFNDLCEIETMVAHYLFGRQAVDYNHPLLKTISKLIKEYT